MSDYIHSYRLEIILYIESSNGGLYDSKKLKPKINFPKKSNNISRKCTFLHTKQSTQNAPFTSWSLLVDTEQNTTLKNGSTVLNTWSTEEWNLLGVDSNERIAFFEATDSWLLAN